MAIYWWIIWHTVRSSRIMITNLNWFFAKVNNLNSSCYLSREAFKSTSNGLSLLVCVNSIIWNPYSKIERSSTRTSSTRIYKKKFFFWRTFPILSTNSGLDAWAKPNRIPVVLYHSGIYTPALIDLAYLLRCNLNTIKIIKIQKTNLWNISKLFNTQPSINHH